MRAVLGLLAVMLLAGAVGGCGKKGAPSPPGPAENIIFPRTYPRE